MNFSGFSGLDLEEFIQKPVRKYRHVKFLSESLSTNFCTIDFDTGDLKDFDEFTESLNFSRKLKKNFTGKSFSDLPERLNNSRQISENKVKFMRAQKEIKELAECTFHPKTNRKFGKTSMISFSKKQIEYAKSRNTAFLKLRVGKSGQDSCRSVLDQKKIDPEIFVRLYRESKVQTRTAKRHN